MSNQTAPSNEAEVAGKSPNRSTRNLNRMSMAFPKCPICNSDAGYKITGIAKNVAVCFTCKAGWTSQDFFGDVELKALQLVKVGRNRKLGKLLPKLKSVSFWQRFDIDRSEEMDVDNLLNKFISSDDEGREMAKKDIKDLGDIALGEVRSIAEGTQPSNIRIAALLYLARLEDENEVPILTQALLEEGFKFRINLLNQLIELAQDAGMDAAIPPVIEALKQSKDPHVRLHAAVILREIKSDRHVIDALADALHDFERPKDEPIIATSIASMIVQGAKQKIYLSVSEAAVESLAKMGDPYATKVLTKFMLETDSYVNVKAGSELMKEIGTVDYIIECLNSENDRTRSRAAGFLVFLKDERAFDPLIAALSDGNSIVRMNAMSALASIGDKRAIEPIKLACDDAEKKEQKHAKDALKILDAR